MNYLKIVRYVIIGIAMLALTFAVAAFLNYQGLKYTYNLFFERFSHNIGINIWLLKSMSVVFSIIALGFGFRWFWQVISPSPLIKRETRRNSLIGLGSFFILYFMTMYFFTRGNFDQKCYAATLTGGYEYCDCGNKVHPIYGTEVKPVTPEMIPVIENQNNLSVSNRVIPTRNQQFFFNDKPLLFFFSYPNGKLEFFSKPGKHPQFNQDLIPVNTAIVQTLFSYWDSGRDSMIVTGRENKNTSIHSNSNNSYGANNTGNSTNKTDQFVSQKTCNECNGTGFLISKNSCNSCQGKGKTNCTNCDGKGKVPCLGYIFAGPHKLKCPQCYPGGYTSPKVQAGWDAFYEKMKHCEICHGAGEINCPECQGTTWKNCSYCEGKGLTNCKICSGSGLVDSHKTCPTCNGSGKII
jgi:hypothetical protein